MNLKFDNFENKKIAVAVSGGADSMALMYMVKSEIINNKSEITVLHVNHNLRTAADAEEKYVVDTAKKLNLPCVVFKIDSLPAGNLESAARDARYKLMTDWCRENGVDVLLTAHHADDQIETFLMNLGRGSGVYGLAAMRPETLRNGVKIIRPLLDMPRAELEKYCAENKIKYFNDEMNADEKYTRVKIRKNRHLLRDKLGISDERILLAIKNLDRARDALDEIINYQLSIINSDKAMFDTSFLFSFPYELQLKFMGEILRRVGGVEYRPRLASIERLLKKITNDTVATLGHCAVRRFGDRIMVAREGESLSFRKKNEKKSKIKTDKTNEKKQGQ